MGQVDKSVFRNCLNEGEHSVETHGRTLRGKLLGRGSRSVEVGVVSQYRSSFPHL